MKYIRTKDGIGIFRKAGDGNNSNYDYVAFKEYACPYNGLDIIKQADNIEELCDCVVENRVNISDELPFIVPKYQLDEYRKLEQFGGNVKSKTKRTVVCCIWVIGNDIPTLKPIAQMNDKGDLELL